MPSPGKLPENRKQYSQLGVLDTWRLSFHLASPKFCIQSNICCNVVQIYEGFQMLVWLHFVSAKQTKIMIKNTMLIFIGCLWGSIKTVCTLNFLQQLHHPDIPDKSFWLRKVSWPKGYLSLKKEWKRNRKVTRAIVSLNQKRKRQICPLAGLLAGSKWWWSEAWEAFASDPFPGFYNGTKSLALEDWWP